MPKGDAREKAFQADQGIVQKAYEANEVGESNKINKTDIDSNEGIN